MNRRDFSMRLAGAVGALSLGNSRLGASSFVDTKRLQGTNALRVNGDRINQQLTALSEFGKNPYGGVSRTAYSDADKQGRAYVMGLMREAGLETSIDVAGNIIGKRAGSKMSEDIGRRP